MKRIIVVASLALAGLAPAQNLPRAALPAPVVSEPTIVERGANHREWRRTTPETLPNGRVITRASGYTELATGLHYLKDGQWAEAREEIELFQDGAIARQGQMQVIFAPNLATPGAIDLLLPDQKRLRTHVLGLAVRDRATGRSELVAEVKDCLGELHPPNVVIYSDAFTEVHAAVRYTYNRDRFEQDIILFERLALPAGYGAATTVLEIWTEAVDVPEPARTARAVGSLTDETLDWGSARIGRGRAFQLEDPQGRTWSAPMAKEWTKADGRTFLIEAVEYQAVRTALNALPAPRAGAAVKPPAPAAQLAALKPGQRTAPPALKPARTKGRIQTAGVAVHPPGKGLVLDYVILSADTNGCRFRGDETYLISGAVNLGGTVTFEGGAVLKIPTNATYTALNLVAGSTVTCATAPYRPVIITSKDDDSVGAVISGSTGQPRPNAMGDVFGLYISTPSDLTGFRFSYGAVPLYYDFDSGAHTLSHAQIVHAKYGVWADDLAQVRVRNALMYDVSVGFHGSSYIASAENLTVHLCGTMGEYDVASTNSPICLTNTLLIAVTNWGTASFSNDSGTVAYVTSDSGVFSTVGASAHYLLNNTYRNSGTTNLHPDLLANLRQRTTYPPIVLSNTISIDTTLYPQAQRDTDTPDLGWHADPLDFVAVAVAVTNATLTLAPGVALGVAGSYGLVMVDGSRLVSEGTPTALNRLVRYDTVQEMVNTNWAVASSATMKGWNYGVGAAPLMRFHFTEWSTLASVSAHFDGHYYSVGDLALTDCQFYAGLLRSSRPDLHLTNCLLHRVTTTLNDGDFGEPFAADFRNSLLYGGKLDVSVWEAGSIWSFLNNAFDATLILTNTGTTNGYNAYTTNVARLFPTTAGDVLLAATNFTYQTGPLGRFYQPTNSALLNVGSTWATNAGLYHYTTTTNQVTEGSSVLDLSFHYIALNGAAATSTAADGETDGYFDYGEDLNGNGVYDASAGETDWKTYHSRHGIGSGPGLVVFTPLK